MRTDRPTCEEAEEARQHLEAAIAKFADDARHPKERGTPDPDPTWKPRPSTLRCSYIKNGGWAWSMQANDQQVVAFYIAPQGKEPYGAVTAHGHARHNFWQGLKDRHIYPSESPWREWYDCSERRQLDEQLPGGIF